MSSINYDTSNMGTVVNDDGLIVHLTTDAEFTGRCMPDHLQSFSELAANGKLSDGRDAVVYWMFEDEVLDVHEDLSNLDWDNVDRIEVDGEEV